jgi:hypothetical protein
MSEGLIIGPKSVATGQSRSSANCCSTALFIRLRPLSSAVKCALDQMRNAIEDSEIGVDLCLDSGTPNLQDHWRAAGEFGPVYLRD